MPFEDFYKAEDKSTRRWWICLAVSFLLVVAYLSAGLLADNVKFTAESSNDTRLKRIENMCANLPTPEKFNFVAREIADNGEPTESIVYYYRSERTIDEILPFFTIWFAQNGWQSVQYSHGSYTKENLYISIGNGELKQSIGSDEVPYDFRAEPVPNFQIYCTETTIPNIDRN